MVSESKCLGCFIFCNGEDGREGPALVALYHPSSFSSLLGSVAKAGRRCEGPAHVALYSALTKLLGFRFSLPYCVLQKNAHTVYRNLRQHSSLLQSTK